MKDDSIDSAVDDMPINELRQLSELLRERNALDEKIAQLIGRPAHSGHIAEFVAAMLFDIALQPTATSKAIDGYFRTGKLSNASVNIKYGSRRDGNLGLFPSLEVLNHPDYYLVMTGPRSGAISSKGKSAPWLIQSVYLFESEKLLQMLVLRGRLAGTATSIRSEYWDSAEVYPNNRNPMLDLNPSQIEILTWFAP